MESITRSAHFQQKDTLSFLVGALLMFDERISREVPPLVHLKDFVRQVPTIRLKYNTQDGRKFDLFAAYNMLIMNALEPLLLRGISRDVVKKSILTLTKKFPMKRFRDIEVRKPKNTVFTQNERKEKGLNCYIRAELPTLDSVFSAKLMWFLGPSGEPHSSLNNELKASQGFHEVCSQKFAFVNGILDDVIRSAVLASPCSKNKRSNNRDIGDKLADFCDFASPLDLTGHSEAEMEQKRYNTFHLNPEETILFI